MRANGRLTSATRRQARTATREALGRIGAKPAAAERRLWTAEETTEGHARYVVLLYRDRTPEEEREYQQLRKTLPMDPGSVTPQDVRAGLATIAEARCVLDTWEDALRNPRREGTHQQATKAHDFFYVGGELAIPW